MGNPNRATQLGKIHKVLKKHYEVVTPPERTLLEHLLYGCLLENSAYEKADEVFARLTQTYFDWNEMRVTTANELAESLAGLAEPENAAANFRRALQGVFETHYAFDLEPLKKQNIGKALEQLEKFAPNSQFAVAYANQHGLGGHHIPVDRGTLHVLVVLGVITESEWAKNEVPGMERAIPKNKGLEFASLLHNLGAEFHAAPYSTKVRSLLLEIDPEAKDRLPKRAAKKEEPPAPAAAKIVVRPGAEKPVAKANIPAGKPGPTEAEKGAAKKAPPTAAKPPAAAAPEAKKKERPQEKRAAEAKPAKPAARKPEPAPKAKSTPKNTISRRKPR